MRASKLGTIVRLPDGRVGTTVFNGLCGVGIKWGRHDPNPKDFEGSHGDLFGKDGLPSEVTKRLEDWHPDALLRYPDDWGDGRTHFDDMELVGEDFEIERDGLEEADRE